jgi:hypothetical protein
MYCIGYRFINIYIYIFLLNAKLRNLKMNRTKKHALYNVRIKRTLNRDPTNQPNQNYIKQAPSVTAVDLNRKGFSPKIAFKILNFPSYNVSTQKS